MAETAGLVVGGVGLLALFDSCMSGFQYLEAGAHYGRDYNRSALKVSLNQLRLAQWRNSVELVEDPSQGKQGLPVATPDQASRVQELLEEIEATFEEAERTAKRHKLKQVTTLPPPPPPAAEEQQVGAETASALVTAVKARAMQRQDKSSLKQKTLWALHDQRKLKKLVDDQREYITDLVDLFPNISAKQLDLARTEAGVLLQQLKELRVGGGGGGGGEASVLLEEATKEVYPELGYSLKAAAPGSTHTYRNVKTLDDARAHFGDIVGMDYRGAWSDAVYTFDDVVASGKAIQSSGTIYGAKSVWD